MYDIGNPLESHCAWRPAGTGSARHARAFGGHVACIHGVFSQKSHSSRIPLTTDRDRTGKIGREEWRPMPSRGKKMIEHDLNKTLQHTQGGTVKEEIANGGKFGLYVCTLNSQEFVP